MRPVLPDKKPKTLQKRKLQTNISDEHRCKKTDIQINGTEKKAQK